MALRVVPEQALERLRNWLLAPLDDVDRRGCLLARATAELAWEDDAVAARSLAAYEVLLGSCRRLVEQAQQAGLVDPTADAEALGGFVLATHRGLEALAKAGTDAATMRRSRPAPPSTASPSVLPPGPRDGPRGHSSVPGPSPEWSHAGTFRQRLGFAPLNGGATDLPVAPVPVLLVG
ncbi:TetR family transcriptional regulator C-terminal domain-containing protein [Dermacoccus abyssi]|uniref:Tetracyclin repressor-like C-terminal domain-containing protein n=1 Tax=Dermacoccus profundi TaxID=322602 RepID=A0ABN2D9K9_9MICO